VAELPLLRRFPGLGSVPRVSLGTFPTPVQRLDVDGQALIVKRDDLSGESIGGNKLRGAEWLLGGVRPGERVITVGPRGSSHALTIARCATRLGCGVTVARWNQVMNDAARHIAALLEQEADVEDARWVPVAYAVAAWHRARGAHWIPAGGAAPLAVLGHVNAAMEFADQVAAGDCEVPEFVIVPLGTGGTAAGLALGFRIAALDVRVVAVRVVPRIVGRASRVRRLANAVASLIERRAGAAVPRLRSGDFDVEDAYYGGGYGKPLDTRLSESALGAAGIRLDDTYSRKAFAAAVARSASRRTLFWLTFDGRLLQSAP
jgi:D-cysteine desulfhydrase